MKSSWDEFDHLERPPAGGELLPYTAWGALVAWGLGPRHCVLARQGPSMSRHHDSDGRSWVAPTTDEDLAWVNGGVVEGATRWGLPAPHVGYDFIAVLPASVSVRQLTGAVNGALQPIPVTDPAAEAAAALAAIDELLTRAGAR